MPDELNEMKDALDRAMNLFPFYVRLNDMVKEVAAAAKVNDVIRLAEIDTDAIGQVRKDLEALREGAHGRYKEALDDLGDVVDDLSKRCVSLAVKAIMARSLEGNSNA